MARPRPALALALIGSGCAPLASPPPPDAAPAAMAVDLVAGRVHTCAITAAPGTRGGATRVVACWGDGEHGQLGDGGTRGALAPVPVEALAPPVALAAGQGHTCALDGSGAVACWGWNELGQLGDATTVDRRTPQAVAGVTDAIAVAAGLDQTCAVRRGGGIACWGDDAAGEHPVPAAVDGVGDAASVAVGELFACAVRRDRAVACWGWGGRGELGRIPASAGAEPPAMVPGLGDITQVAAGDAFACALHADGAIACWGADDQGQLGDGGGADATAPRTVPGIGDAVAIAAGADHACAVREVGSITCWGDDELGQLGDGTVGDGTVRRPVAVAGIHDAVAVAAGAMHTCARRANGALACWGGNAFGQLGDGTTTDRLTPVPVAR